jgi:hypothetical protein
MPRTSVRLTAALAIAVVACAAATVRVASLGPTLQIVAARGAHNEQFDRYDVVVKVRGGETIDEVSVEPLSGPVRIIEGASMRDLPPAGRVTFQAVVTGGDASECSVRIFQKGRAARTYDVPLAGSAR